MTAARRSRSRHAVCGAALALALACTAALADAERAGPGEPGDWVDIRDIAPSIALDLRYASARNFMGEAVYPVARCLLRRSVAERLARVQARLGERGVGLALWDCYRPISIQQRMWDLVKDGRYVARPVVVDGVPRRGSKHNRGAAVDVTLVGADGQALDMPTDHDDFSERAHRDHLGGSDGARANAAVLRRAMAAEGFSAIAGEWWHFDAPDWRDHPLSDRPLDGN